MFEYNLDKELADFKQYAEVYWDLVPPQKWADNNTVRCCSINGSWGVAWSRCDCLGTICPLFQFTATSEAEGNDDSYWGRRMPFIKVTAWLKETEDERTK